MKEMRLEMSILDKLVKVKIVNRNRAMYPGVVQKDGFFLIPIESLPDTSKALVTKRCDSCGEEKKVAYRTIMLERKRRNSSVDLCQSCSTRDFVKLEKQKKSLNAYYSNPDWHSSEATIFRDQIRRDILENRGFKTYNVWNYDVKID